MRRTGEVAARFCTRKRGELLRAPFAPSTAKCTREHAGGTHRRASRLWKVSPRGGPRYRAQASAVRYAGALSEKTEWNRGFTASVPRSGDGGFLFS